MSPVIPDGDDTGGGGSGGGVPGGVLVPGSSGVKVNSFQCRIPNIRSSSMRMRIILQPQSDVTGKVRLHMVALRSDSVPY